MAAGARNTLGNTRLLLQPAVRVGRRAAVVRAVVQDSDQPLSNARIANYVPILVEHNSRSKRRRLARRPDPAAPLREKSDGARGHVATTASHRPDPLDMDTASVQGDNADRLPGGGTL
ncbi:three-helix bundle dimerization domain-containing protein [Streptomyces sp. NBC_00140]|uniref:three-helix bundle dimerization domain-containing protein n=1 Tax=Streptomyces sp. NBC_00140 TaxID=2975664 RepID=UPI002251C876|nr:hypothetical protein [Streptomyces sp. NBC_00140]MCX5328402.1 hypothetical protein [Streptomyces sp. NBC_00140]